MRAKLLLAAAALASSLSVASGATIEAKIQGQGADYLPDKFAEFKCKVAPVDVAVPHFYAECTKKQAHAFSHSDILTVEYEIPPAFDETPEVAERNARLHIERPAFTILGGTPQRSSNRTRRTVADGPRSILMVRVNYADMEVNWASETDARRMMNDPNGGKDVNGMFQKSTYDRLSFPENEVHVITAISRDYAPPQGCDPNAMADMADELIKEEDSNFDPASFKHVTYLIPREAGDCKWTGSAQTGCSGGGCRSWLRTASPSVLAHELGHNLGLMHASIDEDDDGEKDVDGEYGDIGAIMGNAAIWVTINAPQRQQLGYLSDGLGSQTHDMNCVAQPSDEVTLTISRLDLDLTSTDSPTVYRIPRFPQSTYFLSFKSGADWDGTSAPAASVRDRLQIHTHDGTASNTLFVKGLADGDSFVGRADRGGKSVPLTIRVVAIRVDTITITVNTGCHNHQGTVMCGATISGDTALPGTDMIGPALGGKDASDHFYDFTLDQTTSVIFNGCASNFDTVISLFNRLEINAGAIQVTQGAPEPRSQNDDGCGSSRSQSLLSVQSLPAGNYSIVVEGYGRDQQGEYTVLMECTSTNFQGAVDCGETVTGNTMNPGTDSITNDLGGKAGYDHFYDFSLHRPTNVTFDGCSTTFDSVISVFDRLVTDDAGAIENPLSVFKHKQEDEGCSDSGPSKLVVQELDAGDYSVVIEGYGTADKGEYTMAMTCQAPPPTAAPTTSAPTTIAPTTIAPATNAPTSLPPTSAPTAILVSADGPDGCPEGYGNYGLRHSASLGSITVVTTHEECQARCDRFSGAQYNGGCKSFQSGMVNGFLYCKSYGGTSYTGECAWWAQPTSSGMRSGEVGSIHAGTGQENLGGRCCARTTAVFGLPGSDGSVISSSSSNVDDSSEIELTGGMVAAVVVAFAAVLSCLYYVCGKPDRVSDRQMEKIEAELQKFKDEFQSQAPCNAPSDPQSTPVYAPSDPQSTRGLQQSSTL